MAHLSLALLGSFQLTLEGRPVHGFDSNKVRALLAFLAVECERAHSRDTLVGLLWPEQPERQARHSLSQALSNLRQLLGDTAARPVFSVASRAAVGLNPAILTTDATLLARLAQASQPPRSGGALLPTAVLERMREAAELYRGAFLEGLSFEGSLAFEEWALRKREQFERIALEALHALADAHERRDEYELAWRYASRQLEIDPLHEPAHRQLMRVYAWSGRRAAALRQYHECARLLDEELGVPPADETSQLYEAIKERLVAPAAPPHVGEPLDEGRGEGPELERPLFVARERELTRLHQLLHGALAGRGQVAFVVGEAGSGKTALLHEFACRAQSAHSELLVTSGNCNAHTGLGDPYLPFRESLTLLTSDALAQRTGRLLPPIQARRLGEGYMIAGQALAEVGPDLINTFVASPGTDSQGSERPPATPGERDQSRLFAQYAAVLSAIAARRPLVLLLDDLQWADAGSLSLLFHLGRTLQNSRVLIVGSYRPEDVANGRGGERHPLETVANELQRMFGEVVVPLDQSDDEARRFVEALLDAAPNRLSSEFRTALFEQTHGHPLFTVELLRDMQARGDLLHDASGHMVAGPTLDWDRLPARVEGAIAERIGRLDEGLRELLTVAAVEGEDFTAEVLAVVQSADVRGVVRRLSGELDRQHRLVVAHGVRQVSDRRLSRYRFRHSLFQKYLHSRLDRVERAYLHGDVGTVLETIYGGQASDQAVQLARHFQEAGGYSKAVGYLRQAGERAIRLSAYDEAAAMCTRALALLHRLPDTPERARQELEVQINLGVPLAATRGFAAPEVERAFARSRALCQQIGATPELFPTLWGLFSYALVRADEEPMRELATQLLETAGRVDDQALQSVANWAMGVTLLYVGEPGAARSYLEQMIAFYSPQQHRAPSFIYTTDPGVACRFWSAWALWLLGQPDQAVQRSDEAIALARQLAHPFSLAFALFTGAALHQFRREPEATRQMAEAAITLSAEHGFPFFNGLGLVFQGWALAEQNQPAAGIELMRNGIAAAQATGAQIGMPHMLALLAEALGKTGQVAEGLHLLDEALAAAQRSGERHYEAEIHRLRGELLQAGGGQQGRQERSAEASLSQALEIARSQGAHMLELRAALSLARLWRQQGQPHRAHGLLAPTYAAFHEGFATADLREAQALLEELETGAAVVAGQG
jgi:DNA-binding SARP family transcriptional activator/predicted ATPase